MSPFCLLETSSSSEEKNDHTIDPLPSEYLRYQHCAFCVHNGQKLLDANARILQSIDSYTGTVILF
jgi:hypothetical protein